MEICRDKGRDKVQNRNEDRPRQAMKVCEAMAKAQPVRIKCDLTKHAILLVPTWTVIGFPYNLMIQAFRVVPKYFSQYFALYWQR